MLGRDIDVVRVREIEPGVTNEEQIRAWFGAPDLTETKPDGTKSYRYRYQGYIDSGADLLVVAYKTKKAEDKRLQISVVNGVVTSVKYTNSAEPSEDVTK